VIGFDRSWRPRRAIGGTTIESLAGNGMHFRHSCMNGAQLGRKVAKNMGRTSSRRFGRRCALADHEEVVMLRACLQFGLLLATFCASLDVVAAPRVWTLTDVRVHRFHGDDPSNPTDPVTGYFIYDDVTQTISNWSVRFPQPFFDFPSFTYVPGNSLTYVANFGPPRQPFLGFSAITGEPGPEFAVRQLQLVPLGALDGNNAVVALDTSESRVDYVLLGPTTRRSIAGGSLTLTPQPPPVVMAEVDEYYHAGLDHYYITASAAEKQDLDSGVHPGWQRTGESFKAYAAGSRAGGSINPVCQFYSPAVLFVEESPAPGAESHFFSAHASECMSVFRNLWWFWGWPQDNVFQIDLPDASGACPQGTVAVHRLWNQRADANHRYTKNAAIRAQMIADGYLDEGVRMCALA
jgi:hypothetical protein